MSESPTTPGGAAAVGWLAGTLAAAAGGYVLGVAPAWSLPAPLHAELGWPLNWVALHGITLGLGLSALGALTILDGLRASISWTRWRTSLTLASLIGVTLVVASQGQSLALTPAKLSPAQREATTDSEWVAPAQAPLPLEEANAARVPVDELLAQLDSRNGPKNLGVVDGLIQHGSAAVPALQAYLLESSLPGRPYAVHALTQILQREGTSEAGLEALLSCLNAAYPEVHARAATGLTLLADPRTVESMIAHYRRGEWELAEALLAISGEHFADRAQATTWWLEHRDAFPAQLRGTTASDAATADTDDQIGMLLGLLRDSGDDLENLEVVGELCQIGPDTIPGLLDLVERRVDGSGWAAYALARVLQDLPPSERPTGALEVLVTCANVEAEFMLQRQALDGLVELGDPRTGQALLAHLDHPRPAVRAICQNLCERLTGQRFTSRAEGEAWWAKHAKQLGPQVGVDPR